jgi:hypothetical protein
MCYYLAFQIIRTPNLLENQRQNHYLRIYFKCRSMVRYVRVARATLLVGNVLSSYIIYSGYIIRLVGCIKIFDRLLF